MIKLYQYDISPFCDKVRRILNTKRQDYTLEEVSLVDTLKGRLRKLSPAGKLPVLTHEDDTISDSTDIAYYLEEQFPEPRLIPEDPKQKAMVHTLEDWADESLYFYEMYLRFGLSHNAKHWIAEAARNDPKFLQNLAPVLLPPAMKRVINTQGMGRKPFAQIQRDLERHIQAIAGWLGGDAYLVGNQLSLADISVFCQMQAIKGTDEGARLIKTNGRVVEWMDQIDEETGGKHLPGQETKSEVA